LTYMTAEYYAVKLAAERTHDALTNLAAHITNPPDSLLIMSDALTALEHIYEPTRPTSTTPLTLIKGAIRAIAHTANTHGLGVILLWVPSHCSIALNDEADKLAQSAADAIVEQISTRGRDLKVVNETDHRYTLPDAYNTIENAIGKHWSREWENNAHCSTTVPSPPRPIAHLFNKTYRYLATIHTQLRHNTTLNDYWNQMDPSHHHYSATPRCVECKEGVAETVEHYLLECESYADQRHLLRSAIREIDSALPMSVETLLLRRPNTPVRTLQRILTVVNTFIRTTGRLCHVN
jgi:hypothetical protein